MNESITPIYPRDPVRITLIKFCSFKIDEVYDPKTHQTGSSISIGKYELTLKRVNLDNTVRSTFLLISAGVAISAGYIFANKELGRIDISIETSKHLGELLFFYTAIVIGIHLVTNKIKSLNNNQIRETIAERLLKTD